MSDKAVSKVELAVATFGEGFNCSQAVLSALAPDLGLDRETALRVAGAFGGGHRADGSNLRSRQRRVDGARTQVQPDQAADDKQAKEKMYALGGRVYEAIRGAEWFDTLPRIAGL